jgi:hypothetical protein
VNCARSVFAFLLGCTRRSPAGRAAARALAAARRRQRGWHPRPRAGTRAGSRVEGPVNCSRSAFAFLLGCTHPFRGREDGPRATRWVRGAGSAVASTPTSGHTRGEQGGRACELCQVRICVSPGVHTLVPRPRGRTSRDSVGSRRRHAGWRGVGEPHLRSAAQHGWPTIAARDHRVAEFPRRDPRVTATRFTLRSCCGQHGRPWLSERSPRKVAIQCCRKITRLLHCCSPETSGTSQNASELSRKPQPFKRTLPCTRAK